MNKRQPCSPYLERPLRTLEEVRRTRAPQTETASSAPDAQPRGGTPEGQPSRKDVTMKPKQNHDAKRKKAWKVTKDAVHAYARNPCRATEIKVKAALDEVKRACSPCQPDADGPEDHG